jgi:diguanylate cyclase (GGDEF)-like protein
MLMPSAMRDHRRPGQQHSSPVRNGRVVAVRRAGDDTVGEVAVAAPRSGTGRRSGPAVQWYVGAAALVWVGLHAAGVLDPLGLERTTFAALALLTTATTLIGVARWRPSPSWPWLAAAGALPLFALGGALRVMDGTLGQLHADRSPVPEVFTLSGYVLFATGIYGAIRARTREQPRGHRLDIVIDAALAALAALALAWIFLISRVVDAQDAPTLIRVLIAAYPPLSVFLVALGTRLTFVQGRRAPLALRLVLVSLTLMLIGDVIYMLVEIGALPGSHLVELPYALAYIGMAMAALHPTMRLMTEPALTDDETRPRARLAIVAIALCVPAAVSVSPSERGTDQFVLATIVVTMTATAALRMFRTLRQHADSEERLAYQATHDHLTGLPNRALVHQRLGHALASRDTMVGLLFIDIDRFKLVNDIMGHTMGDELLMAAGRRLVAMVPRTYVVGRGGGDEFLVVARDVSGPAHAIEVAERIRRSFATPFRVRDSEIAVTASVGVVVQPPSADGATAESMFRDADTAMYEAKQIGGDAVEPFVSSVRVRIAERAKIERELRHALDRHELEVHFQPVVSAPDGHVVGMEALLRWTHPWLGTVRPDRFIPVAEDSGLIVDVGAWVLDQACAQIAQLRVLFPASDHLYVAVNLSARQLRDDQLVLQVTRTLERHGLPPRALCLELTESLLMENVERTALMLNDLRSCGVRISIDDFGTGYSSLSYLKQLPVDEVKIDRSFVTDLAVSNADTSLVSAVVAIATSFGMSTVAEGVEDEEQNARLIELGCKKAQGYLFSRPVPSVELPMAISRLGLSLERTPA